MNLKDLESKISHIRDLPSLPHIIVRIVEIINNPYSTAREVKNIIENDFIQAARVLKLANSSYYGFPNKISTITTAIVLLGFNEIKSLLLSSSIYETFFKGVRRNTILFDHEAFLDHSLCVGICGRIIAKTIGYDEPEEIFVGGLLHDIGRIVQYQFFCEDFDLILRNAIKNNMLISKIEKKIVGYTHNEVGYILSEKWGLSEKIRDMIAFHHKPYLSKRYQLESAIICLADCITRSLEIGNGGDSQIPIISENVFRMVGLTVSDIRIVMSNTKKNFQEMKHVYNF